MDFQYLCSTYPCDKDYPSRTFKLQALTRVIEGKMYESLLYNFAQEQNEGTGEYIPLHKRRPSVRYNLSRTVVDDSVSLLFSEGHFPSVDCKDETTRDALELIIKDSGLNEVLIDAATRGSVGSVAILMRVLKNRVFWLVMPTACLTPEWDPQAPDTLLRITEQYKVPGEVLKAMGYAIEAKDMKQNFWFRREWDDKAETWFLPLLVSEQKEGKKFLKDKAKTTTHSLGFVPLVWVKNLPGGDDVDGAPTMPSEAIDTQIEIDYQLSQCGRGLRYSSDPTLHIKQPALSGDSMVAGAGRAIITDVLGDAKLLEINGTAVAAVIDYVRAARELALETAHGNRSNADKLSAATSGRAMELMNQSLIWLADKLRISYGEGALLELLGMVVKARSKFKLVDRKGRKIEELNDKEDVSLRWPQWYAPTYADKMTQATTLDTLRLAGLISQETGVKSLAEGYDIEDPEDEIRKIAASPPPPNAKVPAEPKPGGDSSD
ncbi:phage portal protein [Pseudomonas arsenicoxydans]|uniref:Phage portal protein n=1 Tax=Pseudomonas arsenicoxydans TaxID=702115 RepID=A0A4P6G7J3_9PSED|nr:phage portal protein [Pseudomonas arsenicoxydans]QAY85390.1 hypothetical protein CUN61_15930 [Pseudomonas arsenicoxydans]